MMFFLDGVSLLRTESFSSINSFSIDSILWRISLLLVVVDCFIFLFPYPERVVFMPKTYYSLISTKSNIPLPMIIVVCFLVIGAKSYAATITYTYDNLNRLT